MKQYLLPLSIATSVIILFIYACYACFFPDFPSQSATDGRFSNLVKPSQDAAAIPTGLSKAIASREYHISYDRARQMLQSPNRKHNLRAHYRPGMLTIQNRIDSSGHNFSLVLKNEGILADGRLIDRPDPAAEPEILENRLLIRHSKFIEEFINNEDGVRQNFIVQQAPAGTQKLEVKLATQGLRIQNGAENELLFFSKDDKTHPRLIYRDLQCWDARNQPLGAHLTSSGQQILISVDVHNATYPVRIDPIVINGNAGNADALLETDQADAWLGFSVASAGDVNGDGYSDVLAGAPYYDHGENNEGAAFLYYGSASGLAPAPYLLESNQTGAEMGYSVSSAGDINGDGFSDIAIGAPRYDNGQNDEGVVFVHLGSAKGIKPLPAVLLERNQPEAHFGSSLALAGDINGDTYSDLVAGAGEFDQGQLNEGAAFVFYGSQQGITPNQVAVVEVNQAMAKFGSSVAGAGDVNADGFNDVLIGAPFYDQGETDEGGAFLFLGSAQGLANIPTVIQGNQPEAHMGSALASAGDLNGDGYSDIIIGAPHYDKLFADQGLVSIHFGSAGGINTSLEITGNQMEENFGRSVACAGDVNGDSYADIMIGSRFQGKGPANEGAVILYAGFATGVNTKPLSVLKGSQANAFLGQSLASAGDINGDGFSDLIVGAHLYDKAQSNEGAVLIWHGSAAGPDTAVASALHSAQPECAFGYVVSAAGDVDGDGYDDILVGAPHYDNGQSEEGVALLFKGTPNGISKIASNILEADQADAGFGTSVSSAGDANGDGYGDIIIGAMHYDSGEDEEGAAFVYFGSSSGLNPVPVKLESNKTGAWFGCAVSHAGDLNDDGFSDIALGAYQYDKGSSNEGIVTIHYGSANGVSIAPSQTLESDQTEAQFGISVACAGDVNADGYADLIVGARYYDKGQNNEGAAFIYQGSKDGLNPVAISVLESNQGDAWMGSAVAPAGDVNGDGFSDVLVGSYAFDNGQKDEGSVFVWYGRADGTNTLGQELNGYQDYCSFGQSVANAGDVNGDGFDDVIVGAYGYNSGQPNAGAAYIYYGSSQGINLNTVAKIENVPGSGGLGYSVAGAGDVNGDGYDDVIIGDMSYFVSWDPQKGLVEGAALVYYGAPQGINTNIFSVLKNNQTQSSFGWVVSSAGDVNGDGYDDVLIGDPNYDKQFDEGAAFVFHGSSQGISTAPAVTLEGNQSSEQLGFSVSAAGDINADGLDDIIVGAPYYNNGQDSEGTALIFYGSISGISNTATTLENNLSQAWMGYSVSGAGDLNGDGFCDIVVGCPTSQAGEGASLVYYGSSGGIDNNSLKTTLAISQPSYFGNSVSRAGDYNGDGYGDLVIGAVNYSPTNTGAAFMFLGSSTGIYSQSPLRFESNVANSEMGISVAGAGDINGDGYSDILVGTLFSNSKGSALVFKGNCGDGTQNNLRLYNSSDLTTPINHTQFPQNNFGAGLYAKSFTGRNKGKLVWETKPLAQGFSKGSNNRITNSTQSTGLQNAYSNLGTTGFELKNIIDKQGPGTKVRVRVKYDPVLALTGQSYGPWRYLPAYLMGNSTAPVPEEAENVLSENLRQKTDRLESETSSELAAVYPNPVSDRLNIDFKDKDQGQNLSILTASGSFVYQSKEFKSVLDVSKFSEGVYFLIITKTDGSHTTHKVLISR